LLRPGGVIMLDNMLQNMRVADECAQEPDVVAIRKLNTFIREDTRVTALLLPISDGVTLAVKRGPGGAQ
jgi:predicted O-methyltransferase YrrM